MRALLLASAVLFLAAIPVRADEEKVPLDKVPKAILETVKKRFPKAEIVGASKEENEDKKIVYEIELKEDGKTTDVTLTPEGAITLIEMQIDAEKLPKAVKETLESKYAKAKIKLIEAVYSVKDGKETLDYYEAHLVLEDKKELEVVLTPDGKIKKTEEVKEEKK